jgi:uncharacterized membrane protein
MNNRRDSPASRAEAADRRGPARASTLTVWFYDSAMGAAAGEVRLKDLQQRGAVEVLDAVTITWMPGAHAPRVGHLRHKTSASAAKGSALGALVGALVLTPALGGAAGAGLGALAQKLRGTGIDRQFLEEMKERLVPGSSALLVLSGKADLDAVRTVIERGRARGDVTLMHASLPQDAPTALVELLGSAPRPGTDTDDAPEDGRTHPPTPPDRSAG